MKSSKNQNLPIVKIVQEKEKFLASLVSFNSRTLAVLVKALDRKSSLISWISFVAFISSFLPYRSSSQTYRNGTCFTGAECNLKGGSASGICAGGYKRNYNFERIFWYRKIFFSLDLEFVVCSRQVLVELLSAKIVRTLPIQDFHQHILQHPTVSSQFISVTLVSRFTIWSMIHNVPFQNLFTQIFSGLWLSFGFWHFWHQRSFKQCGNWQCSSMSRHPNHHNSKINFAKSV